MNQSQSVANSAFAAELVGAGLLSFIISSFLGTLDFTLRIEALAPLSDGDLKGTYRAVTNNQLSLSSSSRAAP